MWLVLLYRIPSQMFPGLSLTLQRWFVSFPLAGSRGIWRISKKYTGIVVDPGIVGENFFQINFTEKTTNGSCQVSVSLLSVIKLNYVTS